MKRNTDLSGSHRDPALPDGEDLVLCQHHGLVEPHGDGHVLAGHGHLLVLAHLHEGGRVPRLGEADEGAVVGHGTVAAALVLAHQVDLRKGGFEDGIPTPP